MKKIIVLLSVLCILAACSKTDIPHLKDENSGLPLPETESESENAEDTNVVPIEEKDFNTIIELDEETITTFDDIIIEERAQHKTDINYLELIDNSTPLDELLSKNHKDVKEEYLWFVSNASVNSFISEIREGNWSTRCPLSSLEKSIGSEIQFVRSNGKYYNEEINENYYALYTVFETEIGGYLYCWFDYYPESGETFWKEALYLDKTLEYNDFKELKTGDDIDKVAKITKSVLGYKKNHIQTYKHFSTLLLTDGILVIDYDDSWKIKDIHYNDNFVFRSVISRKYNKEIKWLDRNITILPQDYPPASCIKPDESRVFFK